MKNMKALSNIDEKKMQRNAITLADKFISEGNLAGLKILFERFDVDKKVTVATS